MKTQAALNYERIAAAIAYIHRHFRQNPDLDVVAGHVHLSPFHFQKLFQDWAGVSPKQFLQYLRVDYAKQLLQQPEASLFSVAQDAGLSGTGRLHDLFVKIEGMTPGEYKHGGQDLHIQFSLADSPFGDVLVASTTQGICHLSFIDEDEEAAIVQLTARFPQARFTRASDALQEAALSIFTQDWRNRPQLKLHLRGTPFQLKVWQALLHIPEGRLTTYSQLAEEAGYPGASRAVGTAIGRNPVAWLIPCHRVIRATGETGEYFWGSARKQAIIGWEAARQAAEGF
ncbi:MAG: methylated-DNA--[protein]-cysteine S-methyltransferase [Bacteroidetes bacterium]|nr:methylated-DNA--[protein]-cysteine S-methyltransferase [Bacteroidota bacterium]